MGIVFLPLPKEFVTVAFNCSFGMNTSFKAWVGT